MLLINRLNSKQAVHHFDDYFHKLSAVLEARNKPGCIQVKIKSEPLNLDYDHPAGCIDQPFHTASIGKLFTAVLVQRLVERKQLFLADPIQRYISPAWLERLFVYQNVDYSRYVTIRHLLGHTSGIADYFDGRTTSGASFRKLILTHPQVHWTPWQLLDFTRENQKAVGMPGRVFNYSDTGYILLGLLVEAVTGKPFGQNLAEEILLPLEMHDTWLMFCSEPVNKPERRMAKAWIDQVEVSRFESLSSDWAGGGIVSTTSDLLKFSHALRSGKLIQKQTLDAMDNCSHVFRPGIYYGLGMMKIRLREFVLLGNLPDLCGYLGILAVHLFHDPSSDAHIILNFGSTSRMRESFRALFEIIHTLQRMQ